MKRHSTVRAIRFQLASQSTDLQSGHSNMDNGKALAVPPSIPPPPGAAPPQCGSDAMSRISKGCCRANRGRETRTNCILTHANCQCPHLPPSLRLRSAAPGKFIALQWPSERRTNGRLDDGCVRAAIATLHFANGR